MKTTILLIRHGQTEWNRIERFRGRSDIDLDPTGEEQAKKTAEHISTRWKPVTVFSSPLKRAMKTAEAIAQRCLIPLQQEMGLIDIDYGEWQGLTPEEAREKWPNLIENWYQFPQEAFIPGGELLMDVKKSATDVIFSLLEKYSGNTIALVSHTVINRLLLLSVLDLQVDRFWHLRQEPCAINVFEVEGNEIILSLMNDTCHLDK
jgi:probable phosphoglycerate mutase